MNPVTIIYNNLTPHQFPELRVAPGTDPARIEDLVKATGCSEYLEGMSAAYLDVANKMAKGEI